MKVIDHWWEDNNLIVVTESGKYKLENCYPISFEIEGLDYNSTEEVTIETNERYS